MAEEKELNKLLELIDSGKKAIVREILRKISEGEALKSHEVSTLKEFEAEIKARKAGPGRRLVSTQKELAEYLGRSIRSVGYYINRGLPVNPDGAYDLDAVDAWFEEQNQNGKGLPHGRPESGDKTGWNAIEREFKAKFAEWKYNEAVGNSIPRTKVITFWIQRIVEVKAKLLALPRKLPPLLEGKEKRDMEAILFDEIYDILTQFARPGGFVIKILKSDIPVIKKILKAIHPQL